MLDAIAWAFSSPLSLGDLSVLSSTHSIDVWACQKDLGAVSAKLNNWEVKQDETNILYTREFC